MKRLLVAIAISALAEGALASGFALYESSTAATALGGALMGKAYDGSANAVNPATLSDFTNAMVSVGFLTEHPRARIRINGGESRPLDPGPFILPFFQAVIPLPADFTFGLGFSPEYGLGTHYTRDGELTWSSRETTIEGFVLNPNLSYAVTKDWSVAVGARWTYFSFEQYSDPLAYDARPLGMGYGRLHNHLEGDNDFSDCGWQIGSRYRVLDNLSVGAVYKSKIDVTVEGDSTMTLANDPFNMLRGNLGVGRAKATLELPQSVALGVNWDITDTVHLGVMGSWTDWSSIDTLTFHLPRSQGGNRSYNMGWRDTWRIAVAPSWDFAEDWTAMLSYVYDSNPCPGDQESSMLPPGDRQLITGGLAWRITENLEADLCYGIVVMGSKGMNMRDEYGNSYHLICHRGLSHAVGFTLTYRF